MLKKWDKPVVESTHPGAKRVGAQPDDVPRDGEWYVMRTETVAVDSGRIVKKNASMKVAAAARYINDRVSNGKWAGFEAVKVREDDKENETVSWHVLGRWV